MSLALSSNRLSPAELTRLADPGITRELRSIPGVAEVLVTGKQERELTVELKPAALQAAGVSVSQVVQALAGAEPRRAGGPGVRACTTSAPSAFAGGCSVRRTSPSWWWPSGAGR